MSTSDVIDDLLTLPQPKVTMKKRKQGFNEKAICITDDNVLKELEKEKERKKEEMIAKRIEREKRWEQKKKETAIRQKKKEERKKSKNNI